jgi:dienelactone hydrolase
MGSIRREGWDTKRKPETLTLPMAVAMGLSMTIALQTPPSVAATGVSVRQDYADPATSPFPSDRLTARDWTNYTFRRVNLPKPDCAVRPNDCEDIDVINTLDGFSTQPRIAVPFTGDIDPASVSSSTIYLLNLGDTLSLRGFGQKVGINQVVWDSASRTLAFESDELLQPHSRYLLVVTDGVRDAGGHRIVAGSFGAGNGQGEYHNDLHRAAQALQLGPQKVVAASLFTTQSIATDLVKIMRRIKQSMPSAADFMIGRNGGAAPVRALFPLATLGSVQFARQSGTAPAFAPPAALPITALTGVGHLAYAKFRSPDYLNSQRIIPATGTLTGMPQPTGSNELVLQLFLPAGPKPAAGWPVAIFAHGGGSSQYGGLWRVAGALAQQGVALLSINLVGNGGGALGTLAVAQAGLPNIIVDAGGRGIDLDGNGLIDGQEGSRPLAPLTALFNRDGLRQSAADFMQLVRQVEVGIDADGDGRADLDRSRIFFVGQSTGGSVAAMVLGVEPNIRAGVLNVTGGSGPEQQRLGAIRPIFGQTLAARVPSLINVGGTSGFEFDENIPFRDLPPVTRDVPGAMVIAQLIDRLEWAQQSANPVAYAPLIRKQPLPGSMPKPLIVQLAKGDKNAPNPTSWALLRDGDLAERTTFFRNDLTFLANPLFPKDPHFFLTTATGVPAPVALAAHHQIATFFASDGAQIIDPDGTGPLFETPIPLPLQEALNFIP